MIRVFSGVLFTNRSSIRHQYRNISITNLNAFKTRDSKGIIRENSHKLPENPRKPPENPRKFDFSSRNQKRPLEIITADKKIDNVNEHENDKNAQNRYRFEESVLVHKIDRNKIPLAVILGWAASVDKNVVKYADIYKDLGYHTIRIAPSLISTIFKTSEHQLFAEQLLKSIKNDLNLETNPIAIHLMSNAGTLIYRNILELSDDGTEYALIKPNIKSVIYDSAPGLTNDYLDAFESITKLVKRYVGSSSLAVIFTLVGGVIGVLKFLGNNYVEECMNSLIKDSLNVPTLFLYSKTDRFVSHTAILEFIEKRKNFKMDSKIEVFEFMDSDHVGHYLKHQELYLTKVKEHLIRSNLPVYDIKLES